MIIICCLIIVIEFKSPFFYQTRIGKNKEPFTLFKIRTMVNEKVTVIGRILRKTGIDELPQLLNIMKGDLYFVGPRPLTQADIKRLKWDNNFYNYRWQIKPGLTGLAQLSPNCHKKISAFWDAYYVRHHSLSLDIKIFIASALVPLLGKKKVKNIIIFRQ